MPQDGNEAGGYPGGQDPGGPEHLPVQLHHPPGPGSGRRPEVGPGLRGHGGAAAADGDHEGGASLVQRQVWTPGA